MRAIIFGLVVLSLGQARAQASGIPVIARAHSGKAAVVATVTREHYAKALGEAVTAVHDSLAPQLECPAGDSAKRRLQSIGVGIGLSALLGLQHVFAVEVHPSVRMIFSRARDPIFPIVGEGERQ